jgi:predicted nucleotidyltransferase component of viral defense system
MSEASAISMKLLEISRKLIVNHQLILIRFFHERLLYRVSASPYRDKLLLKGGNLLYSIIGNEARPTVDVDFAGQRISNEINEIAQIFRQILSIPVKDEVEFAVEDMILFQINEQNTYSGIRIKVPASLGNIRQIIQIDIGYGDKIKPDPTPIQYPVLLDQFEEPSIMAYSTETVIAEKLQAIIALSELNSRMKDFFDIYTLLKLNKFDRSLLKEAIMSTFSHRKTMLNLNSIVFTNDFAQDTQRNKMWKAFLRKINLSNEIEFSDVMKTISQKLLPLLKDL